MNIDYFVVGIVVVIVLALILFTIRKNNREKKKLEKTIYEEEVSPAQHED